MGMIKRLFLTGLTAAVISYVGDGCNVKQKINRLVNKDAETVELNRYSTNGKLNTVISYYDGNTKTEIPIAKGEFGVMIGDPEQAWKNLGEEQRQQYFLQEWQDLSGEEREQLVVEAFGTLPLETRTRLLQENWGQLDDGVKYEIVKSELEQVLKNNYRGDGR